MRLVISLLLVFAVVAKADQPTQQRQTELTHLLKHDCGSCHGITLKGGLGPALLAEALKDKSDSFLVKTILEGRKGTAMPPWKPFMTEQEALWLVQHRLKANQKNAATQ